MKAPTQSGDTGGWERAIARYLTANRVPVRWDHTTQSFTGLSGYTIRRSVPMRARLDPGQALTALPKFFRTHTDNGLIVVVTNRKYGEDLEDSLVVTRLGTFGPILASHINNDRERYIYAPDNHG